MRIILIKDYKSLGKKYDVVEVKNGYANHLFNAGVAIRYDEPRNKMLIEMLKQEEQAEKEKQLVEDNLVANTLKDKIFVVYESLTPRGTLKHSYTTKDIAEIVERESQIKIDHKDIVSEPKKYTCLGKYNIELKLKSGTFAKFMFNIKEKN